MIDVLGQDSLEMPASQDQHPVQCLTPNGADPALREGVRPRRPHRCAQHLESLGSKDRIERGGELRIPIADQKPEPAEAIVEAYEQVAGLLRHPLPDWMRGHPST